MLQPKPHRGLMGFWAPEVPRRLEAGRQAPVGRAPRDAKSAVAGLEEALVSPDPELQAAGGEGLDVGAGDPLVANQRAKRLVRELPQLRVRGAQNADENGRLFGPRRAHAFTSSSGDRPRLDNQPLRSLLRRRPASARATAPPRGVRIGPAAPDVRSTCASGRPVGCSRSAMRIETKMAPAEEAAASSNRGWISEPRGLVR